MEEYKAVDEFMEKMREVFIHELSVIPSRIKDSKGLTDYRFEYLMDPDDLPEVGTTPKEIIYKDNKMHLYRYKSKTPKKYKTPLLFVYALINKSYILDLQPGNSFVEYWLDQGHDVYLVDWGEPTDEDRYLELDTIIDVYLNNSVDMILDIAGTKELNMFGWCIGGSLAIIYSGLYPEKIKNLSLLTTPFDPEEGGLIGVWADENIFHLDKIIQVYGNMPAKLIRYGVITMYPFIEFKKNTIFYDNIKNKFFLQAYALAEKWINDNIDIPGLAFKKYINDCFQTTNLRDNKMVINGKIVKMSSLNMPILNIAANGDHIVPNASTAALNKFVPTKDYTFLQIEGGHVGLAYDPRSRVMWPKIADWINSRTDLL
jgi:polyhydroxyalkanoate synthase